MLLYATADIHARQSKIDTIRHNINQFKPDLLIIAGDLTSWFNPLPTIAQIGALPLTTLFVRGNKDRRNIEGLLTRYPNIISPHLKVVQVNGYSFTGLDGAIPVPFRTRISLTESWSRAIEPLLSRETILVGHPPPRGTLDSIFLNLHAGCSEIRKTILKLSPLLYICGHIHESAGSQWLGNTLVVNSSIGDRGEGALIELDGRRVRRVEILPDNN